VQYRFKETCARLVLTNHCLWNKPQWWSNTIA